jgi:predicted ArsR family transcriptional regulator
MSGSAFDEQVGGIAALEHPVSRRVYALASESDWIGRDDAAARLGVARSVAAFHLDKLVDAGLLRSRFERTTGRTGPGAGRPAKLYSRSDREIEVSLPPREYALAGEVLAEAVAVASATGRPVADVLADVARTAGERVGAVGSARPAFDETQLLDVLERFGYEPRHLEREIAMANCPFHRLAERQRQLICGMNCSFLSGVLSGVGAAETLTAELSPEPGYCCVRLRPS